MSDIEEFALAEFGIRLTPYQLELMTAWTTNTLVVGGRQFGKTMAQKVLRAYVAKGLRKPQTNGDLVGGVK